VSDHLFDIEEFPEVPVLRARERRRSVGTTAGDARFLNDYPPEWGCCTNCGGSGKVHIQRFFVREGAVVTHLGVNYEGGAEISAVPGPELHSLVGKQLRRVDRHDLCPQCLGMGSLKARVRLEAGHRCERCKHPYIPKGDARMLGKIECPDCDGWGRITDPDAASSRCRCDGRGVIAVDPSGLHPCEPCQGTGTVVMVMKHRSVGLTTAMLDNVREETCPACKGEGKVWNEWSACDAECDHGPPIRVRHPGSDQWDEYGSGLASVRDWLGGSPPLDLAVVEAAWRILTVHHLDGDKANLAWWNLAALCQRCHLEIQAKVVMERIYPWPHSEWFKPHAAGYYAWVYLGEQLTREQTMERLDELLALELASA
jgi:hypothetical protein